MRTLIELSCVVDLDPSMTVQEAETLLARRLQAERVEIGYIEAEAAPEIPLTRGEDGIWRS